MQSDAQADTSNPVAVLVVLVPSSCHTANNIMFLPLSISSIQLWSYVVVVPC
jgi:hypothetical protein